MTVRFGMVAAALLVAAPSPDARPGATHMAADTGYTMADYARVPKIDAHVHVNVAEGGLIGAAKRGGFEMLSINVDYPDFPAVKEQLRVATMLHRRDPRHFHFAGTFAMTAWGKPGWPAAPIAEIDAARKAGAVAIKVWKNVGMVERDAAGKLVMLDDKGFDPIARHLQRRKLPLIAHQGEPHNCWLPLDKMTTDNDRAYFAAHPNYHMYLHPEMPSYDALMAVRDRFVSRHPRLPVAGAHMASLEWNVDELARFLDAHPNAVVDLAARMAQVQHQSSTDREKVRAFFIRYADRLMYATDLTENPGSNPAEVASSADTVWRSDWRYLATGETQRIATINRDVPGLALPRSAIDRIYRLNAQRFFGLRRG